MPPIRVGSPCPATTMESMKRIQPALLPCVFALLSVALASRCTSDDAPDEEPAEVCAEDVDCESFFKDLSPCEEAFCELDHCARRPGPDDVPCGASGCTTDTPPKWQPPRLCAKGVCLLSSGSSCDDGEICTADKCDSGKGCHNPPAAGPCDDGSKCTKGDACKGGACVGGAKICECSIDKDCVPLEDGNACNGTMICNKVSNTCLVDPGSVVACNPALDTDCIAAQCEPTVGTCDLKPLPKGTSCDDGNDCTEKDACDQGQCNGTKICEK